MQKNELRNYTKKGKYEVTYWGWLSVSLGLCDVCSLHVVVHALHVVSN
jgi:hypothetical protein